MFGPFRSAAQAGAAVAMAGALTGAALAACDHDGAATPRRPTETPASDAVPATAAKKPRNVYQTAPARPDRLPPAAADTNDARAKKPKHVARAGR